MDREGDVARVAVAWRELRRVASTGRLRHRFRTTSAGVLELAQVDALTLLVESEGRRMADLAEVLRVDASTATRAVQRLVDAGLAVRSPDPCDRRGVVVVATPLGRTIRNELTANGRGAMAELLADFDDEDLRAMADLLDRFVTAIDVMATSEPEG
jgi:DNA-binding MarR family transcriptional regulator